MSLPGDRLRHWAARLFSEQTMECVIDPVLADLQAEYAEARKAGRVWRSRTIRLAGYLSVVKSVGWYGCTRLAHAPHAVTGFAAAHLNLSDALVGTALIVTYLTRRWYPLGSVVQWTVFALGIAYNWWAMRHRSPYRHSHTRLNLHE